jgi:hypothetical protein
VAFKIYCCGQMCLPYKWCRIRLSSLVLQFCLLKVVLYLNCISEKNRYLLSCDIFESSGLTILNFCTRKVCYLNNKLTKHQMIYCLRRVQHIRYHGNRLLELWAVMRMWVFFRLSIFEQPMFTFSSVCCRYVMSNSSVFYDVISELSYMINKLSCQ